MYIISPDLSDCDCINGVTYDTDYFETYEGGSVASCGNSVFDGRAAKIVGALLETRKPCGLVSAADL